jgi:hypothetical protein
MITPFEYVTVLISIILGMGLTQIVAGLAQLIHRWNNTKLYLPHLILIILLFVIHIQEWWVTYEMRRYQYWRLPTFLVIILYPVNLYILARLLFPIRWPREVDLKKFYFQNYRRIYLLIIISAFQSILDNVWLGGYHLSEQGAQFTLIALLSAVVIARKEYEWIHQSVTLVMLSLLVVSLWLSWDNLIIVNQ